MRGKKITMTKDVVIVLYNADTPTGNGHRSCPKTRNIKKWKGKNNMACRKIYQAENAVYEPAAKTEASDSQKAAPNFEKRLFFGVDSGFCSDDLLQNNISHFEWVVRNKLYPNFVGRNMTGENSLTKAEIEFLRSMGCKIAPVYRTNEEKRTEEQGKMLAKKIGIAALELDIPEGTAIFLEIGEKEVCSTAFMRGLAKGLSQEGYTPGFQANTDAKFGFDREYSRGMQTDKEIFSQCLIWSVSPSLDEYSNMTTTHLIYPDYWIPFAPSGIHRDDIAVWQYGTSCHPIDNDAGERTVFNLDLVKNENIIIEKMF